MERNDHDQSHVQEHEDDEEAIHQGPTEILAPKISNAPSNAPGAPPYSRFTRKQRIILVAVATVSATFTGFSSNIYFPAIPTIARDLGTTIEHINLTVTAYMIFQAISPTLWGALSDVYGRRPVMLGMFITFLGACIGLALTSNLAMLMVFRCLQSTGSASTVAIGAGMIGDITRKEERGGILGIFQAGMLTPLALGPVLGGIFAQTLGWRAIFWFLTIYASIFLVGLVLFHSETLRSIVGDGSVRPEKAILRTPFAKWLTPPPRPKSSSSSIQTSRHFKMDDLIAPIRILLNIEVFIPVLFMSLHYTLWQMTVTAQSSLFKDTYNLSELQIGLTYLTNGAGCIVGSLTTGMLLDREYQRYKRKYAKKMDQFPLDKARLRTTYLWCPMQCAAVIVFGWTLDKQVHISVPCIAGFFLAWSVISIQAVVTTYLVDRFPKQSASATASLNLVRCLMGAGGTAVIDLMTRRIGVGWSFTVWTFPMLLTGIFVVIQMRYGPKWRQYKQDKALEKARANHHAVELTTAK